MCGIISFYCKDTTKNDLEVLKRVMIESRIRGKHASGIAWYNGRTILSVVEPMPIDQLVDEFNFDTLVHNKQVSMIAHARYSTSNLKYNQPIIGKHMAVAHNGVISQASPDTWEDTYGYKCETQNDSELLLRALEDEDSPFEVFPDASIAAVVLDDSGAIHAMRNGLRPLWCGKIGKGTVYASTFDILNRSGVKSIKMVKPNIKCKELQRRNMTL